jgi:hypothetical protein
MPIAEGEKKNRATVSLKRTGVISIARGGEDGSEDGCGHPRRSARVVIGCRGRRKNDE